MNDEHSHCLAAGAVCWDNWCYRYYREASSGPACIQEGVSHESMSKVANQCATFSVLSASLERACRSQGHMFSCRPKLSAQESFFLHRAAQREGAALMFVRAPAAGCQRPKSMQSAVWYCGERPCQSLSNGQCLATALSLRLWDHLSASRSRSSSCGP